MDELEILFLIKCFEILIKDRISIEVNGNYFMLIFLNIFF